MYFFLFFRIIRFMIRNRSMISNYVWFKYSGDELKKNGPWCRNTLNLRNSVQNLKWQIR